MEFFLLGIISFYFLIGAVNYLKQILKIKKLKKLGEGFPGGDGLAIKNGTIYISSWKEGKVYEFKNGKSKVIIDGFKAAADIALSRNKTHLIIPDMLSGTVTIHPLK